jgi:type II restriction/modification system DNA methylase subunit YeeA
MLGKYIGESEQTYNKIIGSLSDCGNGYIVNQLYHNTKYNKYFFINSKGYLHVYIKNDEYMLTKDNDLKWIDTMVLITDNDKKNFIEYLQNAIDIE